jgi:hypothetical protein
MVGVGGLIGMRAAAGRDSEPRDRMEYISTRQQLRYAGRMSDEAHQSFAARSACR